MKKILVAILFSFTIAAPFGVAAAATPAAPSSTAETTTPGRVTLADTDRWRVYVGGQLGDSTVGGSIGLQVNKMFSLEAIYNYVDTIYQPNNTVDSHSVGMAGIAMFPFKLSGMEPFSIFAKAGYERTTDKSTTSDPGLPGLFPPTTTVTTTKRKRVTVGAGVQYEFSSNVNGRLGMNAIGSDHSVYLAAIYKF
jgi:opacity protein-like surface antigen